MFSVRQARPNELSTATTILSRLNFNHHIFFSPEKMQAFASSGWVYIAVDTDSSGAEEVAGAMVLIPEAGSYKIHALACQSPLRLRDAGKALVEYASNRCKEKRVPKLWAWSLTRYRMERFAHAWSFTEVTLLQKQFFGEDCWFFGRIIPLDEADRPRVPPA